MSSLMWHVISDDLNSHSGRGVSKRCDVIGHRQGALTRCTPSHMLALLPACLRSTPPIATGLTTHIIAHSLTTPEQPSAPSALHSFTFAHIRGHADDTPTPPTLSRPPHHHLSSSLSSPLSTASLLAPPHQLAIQHLTQDPPELLYACLLFPTPPFPHSQATILSPWRLQPTALMVSTRSGMRLRSHPPQLTVNLKL